MNKKSDIVPVIEIKNLHTYFDGIAIHEDINLKILPNRIITLIGASGCGKTTLIREILALHPPTSGEILILGNSIANFHIEDLKTKSLLSKVGMMFQHGALFSSSTVVENVMYPLVEYSNFSKNTIKEIAELKLTLTGLPKESFTKYPQELSGGMLKRVALARALALDPSIIFLDEPTSGLDPNSADALDKLLSNLQEHLSLTIVMITHDLNSIWNISDELIYMGNKTILLHDTVEVASTSTQILELYQYFNGERGLSIKNFYQNIRGKKND